MSTLSIQDVKALQDVILLSAVIISVFGFFSISFAYSLFDRFVIRRFRRPAVIKTKNGNLYRSYSGVYVSKDELDDFNRDHIFKNKQRHMNVLEYRLNRLKSQIENENI